MPPFRAGLLKRKIDSPESIASAATNAKKEEDSDEEGEELLASELGIDGDSTDSEAGEAEQASDTERDEVLFDDDADSTLGDDEENVADSDESSELTDSDDDDDDNDSDAEEGSDEEVEENEESSEAASGDSGEESGIGQTHSGSSNDEGQDIIPAYKIQKEKQTEIKTKPAAKTKQKVKKQTIQNDTQSQSSDDERKEKSGPKTKVKAKQKGKQTQNEKAKTKSSIDALADKIKESNIQPVEEKDEYESGDTSDEEDRRNTVGEVPAWWYKEYPHVGYDLDGKRILRPQQRDAIDDFLKQCEDPDFWRTVRDPSTGQDIILSKEDLELISRIRQGQVPNPDHDEYKPWVEWFSREVLATPIRAFPEHKRSFLPSQSDAKAVARIVHALKMGWAKTRKQIAEERRKKKCSFLPSQSDAKAVARIVHALKMGWAKTRKQIAEERRKKKVRYSYKSYSITQAFLPTITIRCQGSGEDRACLEDGLGQDQEADR
ncbi:hypothetical protein NE865_04671 [Phthorimaea operculella]|nr:hypothetical protein NE865_04671 [Phthorimaea operculella]